MAASSTRSTIRKATDGAARRPCKTAADEHEKRDESPARIDGEGSPEEGRGRAAEGRRRGGTSLPVDGSGAPLRGAHGGAVHAGTHRRLLPPGDRRGGRERRGDRPAARQRLPVHE